MIPGGGEELTYCSFGFHFFLEVLDMDRNVVNAKSNKTQYIHPFYLQDSLSVLLLLTQTFTP